jgi:hypothetical protein
MKKISDFADCRMDMKKMAALNGGATAGSISTRSYQGCGDTYVDSWTDHYGCGNILIYDSTTFKDIPWDCPEGSGYAIPTFALSFAAV